MVTTARVFKLVHITEQSAIPGIIPETKKILPAYRPVRSEHRALWAGHRSTEKCTEQGLSVSGEPGDLSLYTGPEKSSR